MAENLERENGGLAQWSKGEDLLSVAINASYSLSNSARIFNDLLAGPRYPRRDQLPVERFLNMSQSWNDLQRAFVELVDLRGTKEQKSQLKQLVEENKDDVQLSDDERELSVLEGDLIKE